MNGDTSAYDINLVSDVLNQPVVQEMSDVQPFLDIEIASPGPSPQPYSGQGFYSGIGQDVVSTPKPLMEDQSSQNNLINFFGKILDVAGKSYQQVASKSEIQKFKSTPYISSALNSLGYPSVRKPQTGIDTGILTTTLSPINKAISSVFSLSPMVLIAGVGILVFVVMMGKK